MPSAEITSYKPTFGYRCDRNHRHQFLDLDELIGDNAATEIETTSEEVPEFVQRVRNPETG
jgi:hypothetical protein